MEFDRETGEMVETGEYAFDSNGANKSTELIGKHIGMFDPKLATQLKALELKNNKTEKEIDYIEQKTKLIRGVEKDTSMLEVLIDAVKDND